LPPAPSATVRHITNVCARSVRASTKACWDIILLDEPAAGLSPTERLELIEILTSLLSHIGYIIIEHDLDVALRVVESVTMMHNGRIFKEGGPRDIETDPEAQELYLGGGP